MIRLSVQSILKIGSGPISQIQIEFKVDQGYNTLKLWRDMSFGKLKTNRSSLPASIIVTAANGDDVESG
jgi:hypothetical protein